MMIDPDTKKVVAHFTVAAVQIHANQTSFMSENERFRTAKQSGMSRFDIFVDTSDNKPKKDSSVHIFTFRIQNTIFHVKMALLDRGANRCLIGQDMMFIKPQNPVRHVCISAAGNHMADEKRIGTGIGKAQTNLGTVLIIVHEGAYIPEQQNSILSAVQLEDYGCEVNEKFIRLGGKRIVVSQEGYIFPLVVKSGLPYLLMTRPTQADLDDPKIPHVILTSDAIWNPDKYNNLCSIEERLKQYPESLTNEGCLEYTPTGEIITLQSNSVTNAPA